MLRAGCRLTAHRPGGPAAVPVVADEGVTGKSAVSDEALPVMLAAPSDKRARAQHAGLAIRLEPLGCAASGATRLIATVAGPVFSKRAVSAVRAKSGEECTEPIAVKLWACGIGAEGAVQRKLTTPLCKSMSVIGQGGTAAGRCFPSYATRCCGMTGALPRSGVPEDKQVDLPAWWRPDVCCCRYCAKHSLTDLGRRCVSRAASTPLDRYWSMPQPSPFGKYGARPEAARRKAHFCFYINRS